MMINTVIEQVKSQKYFYRNIYRKALNILIVILFIEAILTAALIYVVTHRPLPYFYASSSDGILTPLKALPEPNRSSTAMLE